MVAGASFSGDDRPSNLARLPESSTTHDFRAALEWRVVDSVHVFRYPQTEGAALSSDLHPDGRIGGIIGFA
jgi:hypothetical protein